MEQKQHASRQTLFMILGGLIGIISSAAVMAGETLYHEGSITLSQLLLNQQNNPTYWFLDSAPFFLGFLGAWLGRRQDQIYSLTMEIREKKEFFEALVNNSPLAIVTLTEADSIRAVNPAFEALFGYSEQEILGQNIDDILTDETTRKQAAEFTQRALRGESFRATTRRRRKDGSFIDVELHAVPVIEGGRVVGGMGLYADISERVFMDAQLNALLKKTEELARTDSLTGLQNRRAILERVEAELSRSRREKTPLCLLLLDLDNLKDINDACGHLAGDRAIIEVASILKRETRAYDTVGRWGGDEFMVILPNTGLERAETVAQRVCRAISDHSNSLSPGCREELSASIGIAGIEDDGEGAFGSYNLFARADRALYHAKTHGRSQVCVYGRTEQSPAVREADSHSST